MREYFDSQRKRILLESGYSLVTTDTLAENILRGKSVDGMIVDDEYDADVYKTLYGVDIKNPPEPVYEDVASTEAESMELLLARIESSPRYRDDSVYLDRLEAELSYFRDSQNIAFLLRVSDLIGRFKEDGVLWGVGRGSSCASLVCYMLEINDIDPIRFDIPFIELSKVDSGDD